MMEALSIPPALPDTSILKYSYKPFKRGEGFCLAEECAIAISGIAIENRKVGVVGMTGRGKSELVQFLGYSSACELSYIKYKDEDEWEQYYPYKENMAVISTEDMLRVATSKSPGTIKTFDEIQEKANNSRDFRTNLNRLFNQLFVLKRPEKNILITDAQWVSMLDRQSRYLYHWYVEMLPISYFDEGIASCKVKRVDLRAMDEKTPAHFPYPLIEGIQYQVCTSLLAPPEIREFYKKHRDEQEKIAEDERIEEEKRDRVIKDARYERAMREDTDTKVSKYLADNPDASSFDVENDLGINASTVRATRAWRSFKND